MINWIANNIANILITGALIAIVDAIVINMVKNKKKGISCSGCSGCSSASSCHSPENRQGV